MAYVVSEALRTLWVTVPILAVFALSELLYRLRGVSAEHTRKLSHVGAGLATLAFPWVATDHWTVLALAVVFVAFLAGTKALGWLPSVHAVARRTRGAHYYPVAVWLTFLLCDGDPALFGTAILVMALSDTGAALVGRSQPIVRYRVIDEDYRSLGGSLALFGLTFGVLLVGLSLRGGASFPAVLVVSLLAALVATAVEGVSIRGLDNLLLPYSVVLVVQRTLALPASELGTPVLGALLVVALLLVTRRVARLEAAGALALFLAGFAAWFLGGPLWLATLALPWVVFVVSRHVVGARYAVDLRLAGSLLAVSLGILVVHGHAGVGALYVPFVASVAAVSALAWSDFARHRGRAGLVEQAAAAAGAALVLLPSLLAAAPVPFRATTALFVVACAAVAPLVARLPQTVLPATGLRRAAGVLGSTAAALAWLAF